MVDLSVVGSVIGKNDKYRAMAWQKVVQNGLEKRMPDKKFACVLRKIMFGCLIMLFVNDSSITKISKMQAVKIKIGAGGISANKGSTSIRFNYADTSFMFLNCHLASGQKEVLDRFNGLAQCYSESIQAFNNTVCGEKPESPDH